ncbi:uncharacterized protein LOC127702244 [Mytilus californianus]|uniref:uncharacterized protein LOC127702244 n=1 Tax=Mytilus californianus TaxID=6549 RepID=UPI002247DBCC|nr:uncharacterized protein LOC127702244 [Mytilus californianus]
MVNQELNSIQFPSVKESSIRRDAIAVCVITGFMCCMLYQLFVQWRDEEEFDLFMKKCRSYHDQVMKIPKFYRDVEIKFSNLESQSTCVHDRFQRASRMIVNEKVPVCKNIKYDFQTLRHNWTKEHSCISRFDVDVLNGKMHIAEQGTQVQLTMAKGFVDRELWKIRKVISEDILSLEEVDKDVRVLQNYFGR